MRLLVSSNSRPADLLCGPFFLMAQHTFPGNGDIMRRANVVGTALVVVGTVVGAGSVTAQTTVGADLYLYSSYVWRGLSLTNKPVAQPDLYVTFPLGNASLTAGGWASIDLGKYD